MYSCTFMSSKFPSALKGRANPGLLCFSLPILKKIGTTDGWYDLAPEYTEGQSVIPVAIFTPLVGFYKIM